MHHRAGWLDPVFVWLSRIGSSGLVFLAIALVLALLWRRALVFGQVVIADAIADVVAYGLKQWIGRSRPPLVYPLPKPLVSVPHDGSFPSGHASIAFACATVLSRFVPRGTPAFFLLAAAIAFSRVYVGVHYPLDVVGGAALGVVVGLTAPRLLAAALRRSPRMPRAARSRSRSRDRSRGGTRPGSRSA